MNIKTLSFLGAVVATCAAHAGAICYRTILDYMLDGERVRITSGERLDIGARRPGAVKKGFDGTQWATVEFSLDAPADGDYEVGMFNDYFGELLPLWRG